MLEFNATFFIAMISFVVFMIIMNAILYKPLERIVKCRKEIIDNNNLKSKEADDKCKALVDWKQACIENARKSSKETYLSIVNEYKAKRDSVLDSERNLSRKEVAIASAELDTEIAGTKRELDIKVKILADIITEKIIGR